MQQEINNNYDVLVIGAGSGGIAAANRAASYGKRCAVFEDRVVGGTCVNVGCVPKKVMWYGAQIAHALEDAVDYGFDTNAKNLDWAKLVTNRQAYIERIHGSYQRGFEKNSVDYIEGTAKFISNHTIAVNGAHYSAPHIIIATGGYPTHPNIPGAEYGISSDDFFALQEQPKSIVIVGAGYIAVEIAGVLAALGSQVTLVLRKKYPIRSFDSMLQQQLLATLKAQNITILTETEITKVEKNASQLRLSTSQNTVIESDALLWAIGRAPNTHNIDLQNTDIAVDTKQFITTDLMQNTNVEGIYAVGDVTGRAALTPVAIAAGRRLADRLFNNMTERHLDYQWIPTVLFTHPPIGTIGMTEDQAREEYGSESIKIYETSFTAMQYAFTQHKAPAAIKLITEGPSERIIGCHMIGPGADEMLQGFAVAIRMGATKKDFDDTVAIHPTFAEELVTLK